MAKVKFRNKYQWGEQDLPVKYVKRNDPRIQASADSIYAYNNTRGNSPRLIINSSDSYQSLNKHKNEIEAGKNDPKSYHYGKDSSKILKNINRDLKEIEDGRSKNFPVEPGAYGSKVTIKKSKKPTFPQKDNQYDGVNRPMDPELKRIAKKNKPINYLSEERYAKDPYYASNTDVFYNQNSVSKKGTDLYKVLKPSTAKVETKPNIEELKKIYPNLPQTEIDKFIKQNEEHAKGLESLYYHPNTYSKESAQTRSLLVPDKPEVLLTGEQYKKYGITPEFTRTTYSSTISETPQFAKPNFRWLPEQEKDLDKIEPKQASFSFTPPEDNRKPKMVPTSQFVNPEGSPASALRFPAINQGFFQKIKSKITGKNPMPYWMDKQGVKRYPHLGENNPEQVKQIQMLKGNLDPKVPEEGAELKRIDKLLADPSRRQQLMSSYQNGVRETKTIKNRKDFKPGLLNLIPGLSSFASGNQPGYNRHEQYGQLGDLYRYYGGMPLKHNVLEESMNKPTKSKDKNAKYISLNKDPEFINEVLENYKRVSSGKLSPKLEKQLDPNNWSVSGYSSGKEQLHRTKKQGSKHHSNAIGRYILGRDKDEKGDYISYYDKFDQGTGSGINLGEMFGVTKPFEIYDRIYLENNDVKHNPGKWLPEVTVTSPSKKQNGVREANSYTFGKEPGVGRAIGKVLTGFADDKGKGYSISPSEVMKNLAMPASLLSGCTSQRSDRYVPQKNAGNPHYKGYNPKYPMRKRGRCW